MSPQKPLILIGASVRSAAESAVRGGFAPWCVDQFGDSDLRAIATCCEVVAEWTDDMTSFFEQAPAAPWMFTGALENQPALVSRLSMLRQLAGCGAATLSLVRDPAWLHSLLTESDLPALGVRSSPPGDSGTWLRKSVRGSAGIGIRFARHDDSYSRRFYYQEFRSGTPVSALFASNGYDTRLIGLAKQLTASTRPGDAGFLHAGSIGPLSVADLPERCFVQASQTGAAVAAASGMRGLFGCDFIFDAASELLWLTEVNPRYSASAEVHERDEEISLVRLHVDACQGTPINWPDDGRNRVHMLHGRRVWYAPQSLTMDESASCWLRAQSLEAGVSDIPVAGTRVHQGNPVCTLRASATTIEDCERLLDEAVGRMQQRVVSNEGAKA